MSREILLCLQTLAVLFLLVAIPILLGLPWVIEDLPQRGWMYSGQAYAIGFFCMLALFEAVSFPAALLDMPFCGSMVVYSGLLLLCCVLACRWIYRNVKNKPQRETKGEEKRLSITVMLFGGIFLLLLLIQLYYAFFYSRTYMAADGYVVYATQALEDNAFFMTDPQTGLYQIRNAAWMQRIIQSYNFFPGYIALLTGLHPATVAYTVEAVLLTIMAYGVYCSLGSMLFDKREDQILFLVFVALFYQFGLHTVFSIVFRLLGVNYEGKAILAVTMTPLMLGCMYQIMESGYRAKIGLQVLVLSVAACALSLAGIYTYAAVLGSAVLCSVVKNRSIKILNYLLYGGCVPSMLAIVYILLRF